MDIDRLLSPFSLAAFRIWRKGEPRTLQGKFHDDSGASFLVSDADFDDFTLQVTDAIDFLEVHAATIAKLNSFPEVQSTD